MDTIVSKSNEKVKYIKSLNDKKFRMKYNAFYVEGIKVVTELLEKAINIMFIAFSESILLELNGGKALLEKLKKRTDIKKANFDKNVFSYMSDTVTPQGVLAVLSIPKYDIKKVIDEEKQTILILDKLQDLGNLGTIIRSADSFKIGTIICIDNTADVYSPKVVRSTMGSVFRVKVIYTDKIDDVIGYLKQKDYEIIGTSLKATTYLKDLKYEKKHVYILGNEANGVDENLLKKSDMLIKIEMENTAESLNVAVATSIILYEDYIKRNS